MFNISSYIEPLLIRYISKFIDTDNLNLSFSLWTGELNLSNVSIKLNQLESSLNLPVQLISGIIDKFRVQIQWRYIMSKPIIVEITNLTLKSSSLGDNCMTNVRSNFEDKNDVNVNVEEDSYLSSYYNSIMSNIKYKIKNFNFVYVDIKEKTILNMTASDVVIKSVCTDDESTYFDQNDSLFDTSNYNECFNESCKILTRMLSCSGCNVYFKNLNSKLKELHLIKDLHFDTIFIKIKNEYITTESTQGDDLKSDFYANFFNDVVGGDKYILQTNLAEISITSIKFNIFKKLVSTVSHVIMQISQINANKQKSYKDKSIDKFDDLTTDSNYWFDGIFKDFYGKNEHADKKNIHYSDNVSCNSSSLGSKDSTNFIRFDLSDRKIFLTISNMNLNILSDNLGILNFKAISIDHINTVINYNNQNYDVYTINGNKHIENDSKLNVIFSYILTTFSGNVSNFVNFCMNKCNFAMLYTSFIHLIQNDCEMFNIRKDLLLIANQDIIFNEHFVYTLKLIYSVYIKRYKPYMDSTENIIIKTEPLLSNIGNICNNSWLDFKMIIFNVKIVSNYINGLEINLKKMEINYILYLYCFNQYVCKLLIDNVYINLNSDSTCFQHCNKLLKITIHEFGMIYSTISNENLSADVRFRVRELYQFEKNFSCSHLYNNILISVATLKCTVYHINLKNIKNYLCLSGDDADYYKNILYRNYNFCFNEIFLFMKFLDKSKSKISMIRFNLDSAFVYCEDYLKNFTKKCIPIFQICSTLNNEKNVQMSLNFTEKIYCLIKFKGTFLYLHQILIMMSILSSEFDLFSIFDYKHFESKKCGNEINEMKKKSNLNEEKGILENFDISINNVVLIASHSSIFFIENFSELNLVKEMFNVKDKTDKGIGNVLALYLKDLSFVYDLKKKIEAKMLIKIEICLEILNYLESRWYHCHHVLKIDDFFNIGDSLSYFSDIFACYDKMFKQSDVQQSMLILFHVFPRCINLYVRFLYNCAFIYNTLLNIQSKLIIRTKDFDSVGSMVLLENSIKFDDEIDMNIYSSTELVNFFLFSLRMNFDLQIKWYFEKMISMECLFTILFNRHIKLENDLHELKKNLKMLFKMDKSSKLKNVIFKCGKIDFEILLKVSKLSINDENIYNHVKANSLCELQYISTLFISIEPDQSIYTAFFSLSKSDNSVIFKFCKLIFNVDVNIDFIKLIYCALLYQSTFLPFVPFNKEKKIDKNNKIFYNVDIIVEKLQFYLNLRDINRTIVLILMEMKSTELTTDDYNKIPKTYINLINKSFKLIYTCQVSNFDLISEIYPKEEKNFYKGNSKLKFFKSVKVIQCFNKNEMNCIDWIIVSLKNEYLVNIHDLNVLFYFYKLYITCFQSWENEINLKQFKFLKNEITDTLKLNFDVILTQNSYCHFFFDKFKISLFVDKDTKSVLQRINENYSFLPKCLLFLKDTFDLVCKEIVFHFSLEILISSFVKKISLIDLLIQINNQSIPLIVCPFINLLTVDGLYAGMNLNHKTVNYIMLDEIFINLNNIHVYLVNFLINFVNQYQTSKNRMFDDINDLKNNCSSVNLSIIHFIIKSVLFKFSLINSETKLALNHTFNVQEYFKLQLFEFSFSTNFQSHYSKLNGISIFIMNILSQQFSNIFKCQDLNLSLCDCLKFDISSVLVNMDKQRMKSIFNVYMFYKHIINDFDINDVKISTATLINLTNCDFTFIDSIFLVTTFCKKYSKCNLISSCHVELVLTSDKKFKFYLDLNKKTIPIIIDSKVLFYIEINSHINTLEFYIKSTLQVKNWTTFPLYIHFLNNNFKGISVQLFPGREMCILNEFNILSKCFAFTNKTLFLNQCTFKKVLSLTHFSENLKFLEFNTNITNLENEIDNKNLSIYGINIIYIKQMCDGVYVKVSVTDRIFCIDGIKFSIISVNFLPLIYLVNPFNIQQDLCTWYSLDKLNQAQSFSKISKDVEKSEKNLNMVQAWTFDCFCEYINVVQKLALYNLNIFDEFYCNDFFKSSKRHLYLNYNSDGKLLLFKPILLLKQFFLESNKKKDELDESEKNLIIQNEKCLQSYFKCGILDIIFISTLCNVLNCIQVDLIFKNFNENFIFPANSRVNCINENVIHYFKNILQTHLFLIENNSKSLYNIKTNENTSLYVPFQTIYPHVMSIVKISNFFNFNTFEILHIKFEYPVKFYNNLDFGISICLLLFDNVEKLVHYELNTFLKEITPCYIYIPPKCCRFVNIFTLTLLKKNLTKLPLSQNELLQEMYISILYVNFKCEMQLNTILKGLSGFLNYENCFISKYPIFLCKNFKYLSQNSLDSTRNCTEPQNLKILKYVELKRGFKYELKNQVEFSVNFKWSKIHFKNQNSLVSRFNVEINYNLPITNFFIQNNYNFDLILLNFKIKSNFKISSLLDLDDTVIFIQKSTSQNFIIDNFINCFKCLYIIIPLNDSVDCIDVENFCHFSNIDKFFSNDTEKQFNFSIHCENFKNIYGKFKIYKTFINEILVDVTLIFNGIGCDFEFANLSTLMLPDMVKFSNNPHFYLPNNKLSFLSKDSNFISKKIYSRVSNSFINLLPNESSVPLHNSLKKTKFEIFFKVSNFQFKFYQQFKDSFQQCCDIDNFSEFLFVNIQSLSIDSDLSFDNIVSCTFYMTMSDLSVLCPFAENSDCFNFVNVFKKKNCADTLFSVFCTFDLNLFIQINQFYVKISPFIFNVEEEYLMEIFNIFDYFVEFLSFDVSVVQESFQFLIDQIKIESFDVDAILYFASLSIIGNPAMFIKSIYNGLTEMSNEVISGYKLGMLETFIGVVNGSSHLVKGLSKGFYISGSGITDSISKNLNNLIDHNENTVHPSLSLKKSTKMWHGVESLGRNTIDGLTGIIIEPIKKTYESKSILNVPQNLAIGLISGSVGLFIKPTIGIADFCTGIFGLFNVDSKSILLKKHDFSDRIVYQSFNFLQRKYSFLVGTDIIHIWQSNFQKSPKTSTYILTNVALNVIDAENKHFFYSLNDIKQSITFITVRHLSTIGINKHYNMNFNESSSLISVIHSYFPSKIYQNGVMKLIGNDLLNQYASVYSEFENVLDMIKSIKPKITSNVNLNECDNVVSEMNNIILNLNLMGYLNLSNCEIDVLKIQVTTKKLYNIKNVNKPTSLVLRKRVLYISKNGNCNKNEKIKFCCKYTKKIFTNGQNLLNCFSNESFFEYIQNFLVNYSDESKISEIYDNTQVSQKLIDIRNIFSTEIIRLCNGLKLITEPENFYKNFDQFKTFALKFLCCKDITVFSNYIPNFKFNQLNLEHLCNERFLLEKISRDLNGKLNNHENDNESEINELEISNFDKASNNSVSVTDSITSNSIDVSIDRDKFHLKPKFKSKKVEMFRNQIIACRNKNNFV
ncbi:hypothetical protein A3Q56_04448 [Intoshia linei]|uniref:Chorein N-terminal domain-containing protein n=1 Tax=Intoshia linei TaxID=1819745 RepID=A0A177B0N6_9BILA|nr:hypothetical protein A3Q56_04448 [Intoshia linei]